MGEPRFLASGDTALVVEFGQTVDAGLSARVLALDAALAAAGVPGIVESVPTLRSLIVHYDPLRTSHADLKAALLPLAEAAAAGPPPAFVARRSFRLPACYDPDLAPDLAEVAETTGLGIAGVVRRHADVTYRVYMVGFLPGQPYMGDTPAPLALPRRKTPRTAVPPGGVAIAVGMTTVYPLTSPGGWHLIARTPALLFDQRRDDAVLLAPGDTVAFEPIGRAEYDRLTEAAQTGAWTPEPMAAS